MFAAEAIKDFVETDEVQCRGCPPPPTERLFVVATSSVGSVRSRLPNLPFPCRRRNTAGCKLLWS